MTTQLFEAIKRLVYQNDNLNMQNFWPYAMAICPKATKEFCYWIDQYKKVPHRMDDFDRSMDWELLFGNNTPTMQKIKFHHIPLEMQIGILFDFFASQFGPTNPMFFNMADRQSWVMFICELFSKLDIALPSPIDREPFDWDGTDYRHAFASICNELGYEIQVDLFLEKYIAITIRDTNTESGYTPCRYRRDVDDRKLLSSVDIQEFYFDLLSGKLPFVSNCLVGFIASKYHEQKIKA